MTTKLRVITTGDVLRRRRVPSAPHAQVAYGFTPFMLADDVLGFTPTDGYDRHIDVVALNELLRQMVADGTLATVTRRTPFVSLPWWAQSGYVFADEYARVTLNRAKKDNEDVLRRAYQMVAEAHPEELLSTLLRLHTDQWKGTS